MNDLTVVLPDIPRIFTAIAEWMGAAMCVIMLKPRITGWKRSVAVTALLLAQCIFLILTEGQTDFLWLLCMCAAVLLMFVHIYICSDVTVLDALYYTCYAFMMAEFTASLEWQIYCYFGSSQDKIWVRYLYMAVLYFITFLLIWLVNRRIEIHEEKPHIRSREMLVAGILTITAFAMSNLGFIYGETPFSGQYSAEIFNIRTMVDFAGMALIYAYHIQWREMRVRRELESMKTIFHNQYVQYQQSQKTIEIINYKYHDLKHHIMALRAEHDFDRRNDYLDKMEEEIKNYEAQNKTGNEVLDTLLTGKSLYCQQNNIAMTCVVDGHLFDFMNVMDICSIFGNALDNAIECEKQIENHEKRLIHVAAYAQKKFLIIRFENYYEGDLKFDGNLPVTTKKQVEFHGYGLKSLRYTVRKYGGAVDVSSKDNWFFLKILIPLPQN